MASQRETPTAPKAPKQIVGKKKYPYFGTYELDYEKARSRMLLPTKQALLAAGMKPMKDFWLNDELMEALIHKELDHMSEQNREDCYIFSTHVWTTILKLRRNPQTGHILHPANRYDPIRYIIWPRREKKRIEAQRKFNPLKRKYLFLPIFQDQHWSLIVVVNPWKTFERLVDPDPTTEVFNMPVNPDGKIETPCDVSEEFAEKYNLTENERHDSNQYSQFAPYESEPVIYHFCSLTKTDWIQKCELACEILTGMFLDESNPDLQPTHEDLLRRGLLSRTENGLQIEHGRKPRRLVCDRATRRNMNRPWPCDECLNNGPNRFQKFLPFRYYHQSSPQQCNEYDCGVYTIYAIRKWFQNEKHIKRYLHTDLENWWSPIDIYNYKYACRRYFDKLANYPDREPVNVFGTPEENGYLKSSKASFAAYKVFKGLDVAVPEETEPKTEPASEVIEEEVISQDDDEEEQLLQQRLAQAARPSIPFPFGVSQFQARDRRPSGGSSDELSPPAARAALGAQMHASMNLQSHPQVEIPAAKDEPEKIETARSMPTKRKNEEEVGASATKRRKTTSIPVSPKPKQSPKTVSSLPEEPVIKPIDAVKFFESRARFAFASTLFKDEEYPRTLRFALPDDWEIKRPAKKRRSSRIRAKFWPDETETFVQL